MTSINGDNLTVPGTSALTKAVVTTLILPVVSTAVDYAALSDEVIAVTVTGKTVTLPAVASVDPGKRYLIKLAVAGTATVAAQGGETIDGAATYSLVAQWRFVEVVNTGTEWLIVGQN